MTYHRSKPALPVAVPRHVLLNAAVAKSLEGRAGPNPLEARLLLRKEGPDRKSAVWYILCEGELKSTRCAEHQRAEAQLILDDFRIRRLLTTAYDDPTIGPTVLTYETILREHQEWAQKHARTKQQKRSAHRIKHECTTLMRFFCERRPADYTEDVSLIFKNWYVDERSAWYADHPDIAEKDSDASAISLLRRLRIASRQYAGKHPVWLPEIEVTKKGRFIPRRWLRKHEVAALLMVCLGCRRDPQTGEWISRTFTDRNGKTRTVALRVAHKKEIANHRVFARLIRFCILTATRHEASLSMTWGGPRPKVASIECDEMGRGTVHRRGYAEVETNKARASSPIRKKLRCLLWIWGKQDGVFRADPKRKRQKFKYLFRKRTGQHYQSHLHYQFKHLVKLAGLGNEVSLHTLKHTAANWCLQAGYRMSFIARMLGTTEETLARCYTDWGSALDEGALAEFDDCEMHQAWRHLTHFDPEDDDKVRKYDKPFIEHDDEKTAA